MRRVANLLALVVLSGIGIAAAVIALRGDPEPAGTCPSATAEAPGASPLSEVVGLTHNLMWDLEADPDTELAELAACGVRAIREDLLWEAVEPEPGRFDWARSDEILQAAARHEIEVLGILGYSAPWSSSGATGEGFDRNDPPADAADFARYAAAVVSRYGPEAEMWRGGRSPLLGVEIWNEAWGWWSWRPDPDPPAYAALAREAAEAVRAASPGTKVVLTADAYQLRRDGTRPPWLEAVLEAEPTLPELVDVYAVHPYPDPRDAGPLDEQDDPRHDFRRVADVQEIAEAADAVRPVWITEVGWSTADADGGVSEDEQARHLLDAVRVAATDWPFVERVFLYTWTRDREDPTDLESGFGLRRLDGSHKPAWQALVGLLADEE